MFSLLHSVTAEKLYGNDSSMIQVAAKIWTILTNLLSETE